MKRAPRPAVSIVATAFFLALSQLAWGAAGAAIAQASVPGAISRPVNSLPAKPAAWPQSAWVKGSNSAVRMIGGAEPSARGGKRLVVGIEVVLGDGWKTYWRHPGDDGGLPPVFVLDQSRNLKSASVMYPVPERIKSLNGTAIGYTKAVTFPVEIEAADPSKPVEVFVQLEYGICREICIPVEAQLTLVLEPRLASMPPELASSLARVPTVVSGAAVGQVLKSAKAVLTGPHPAITFEIAAAAAGERPDLFVEPATGSYLPVPVKAGDMVGGVQRFHIDLKGVDDLPKLAGQKLRLTVTGTTGGSEVEWLVK